METNCCCNNLGRFAHNKDLNLALVADQEGFYELNFVAANSLETSYTEFFDVGDDIIVPQGFLNESMSYKVEIKKPDDSLFTVNDCVTFGFQTYINTNKTCNGNTCDTDNTDNADNYGVDGYS